MKKVTLLNILWKKEVNHWKRIGTMFEKFEGWLNKFTFGLLVAICVSLFHYIFALMHTLYEIFLFIFARKTFKANLQKLALKV
jgi:hypothetical protein